MCGYNPFELYEYIQDKQVADEMGFETVQDLYNEMSLERERASEAKNITRADVKQPPELRGGE